jgi:competence ComEA-like helix-hairpin-helix protein
VPLFIPSPPRRTKNFSEVVRRACAFLGVACLAFAAAVAFAQKKPPATPINLNSATLEQLQQLPGVGPVTAQSILDFRKKSGPFRRVEDLLAVRGISEKRFLAVRPYIMVPVAAKPPAAPKSAAAPPPKSTPPPN